AIVGVERGSHGVDADPDADKAQDTWQIILRDTDDRVPVSRRQWALVKSLVR
ncbi:MAG: DNA-binding response regulator, partial [Herminiimonas sp.]|nr:DNA-binding response regulator [Herminiimonas sp.]